MRAVITAIIVSVGFGGCSQASFKGQEKKSRPGRASTNSPTGDLPATDRREEPLCGDVQKTFNFDVGSVSEPFNGLFSTWIYYSPPFEVDLGKTDGIYLPVTRYNVDDLLVVIGANEEIGRSGGDIKGQTVDFTLPNGAKVLNSPALPGGQTGKMAPSSDVFGTKNYRYRDKTITIPFGGLNGQDVHVNDLIPLGMPVVNYDKVSINDLRDSGYIDSDGFLRIKLALIPHGGGSLSFGMDIKACK
jgi:hypothetical protein